MTSNHLLEKEETAEGLKVTIQRFPPDDHKSPTHFKTWGDSAYPKTS